MNSKAKRTPERLTLRKIDSFQFEGANGQSQDIRWDTEVPGFGIRVFPSNEKSYVIHYRSRGRQRLYTVGKVRILTLEQARDKAKKDIAHRNEVDPADRHRAFLKAPTFGELAKSYLENHSSKNRSHKDDKRRIEKRLLPKWKARKLDAIAHHEVMEIHRSIGAEILKRKSGNSEKHYEANRTLALIRSMFNKAIAWGMLNAQHRNPAIGITAYEELERERWLTNEEMKAVADGIQKLPNIYCRGVFWLALLTGMRKEEVVKAQWSYFDPESMTFSLPTTKNRHPHVVAITEVAKAVIQAMPKIEGNPHIFCGRIKGKHLVNISKPWDKVRTAAKVPDVRIHDLRRSVGSWLGQQGESVATVKKLLNHADVRTTMKYMRSAKGQERQALETSSRKLRPMIGSLIIPATGNQAEPTQRHIRIKRPEAPSIAPKRVRRSRKA